jgi:cellulose synthase/poly-beta-1,6-N-acetylglucosamine synthase-like glycosyltransferase
MTDRRHGRALSAASRFRWSSKEVPLNWNVWIRQIHRWLSIIFTVTVLANFITMAVAKPPSWIVYSPLLPLFLLLFTGLYMFVLPYAAKARSETALIAAADLPSATSPAEPTAFVRR